MGCTEYLLGHLWELLALVGLLAASGFFSGSETALFNLTRSQVHRLGQSSGSTGRLVASLVRRRRQLLQALLLGNMIVNTAYSAIAAVMVLALAQRGLPSWSAAALALATLLVLILVGEVAPKMLAYRTAERWSLTAAIGLTVITRVFSPIVLALEKVIVAPAVRLIAPQATPRDAISTEELGALLDLSARRGLITHDINDLLQEITQLTDIRVADVMVPRVDVVAYDVDAPPGGVIELVAKTHLRKVPVYERDMDHLLGVVDAKRVLLNPQAPLRRLVVKVPFIPEAANIERALLQLRVKRAQVAIVVDEYGGAAGLIALEDIIEQIVGSIEQTHLLPPGEPVEQIGHNEYLIEGDLAIHEWAETFKINLSQRRLSTIGGFVISLLGRIPAVGDSTSYRNLQFTVEAMRGRRISKLRLKLVEATP